MSNLNDIPAAAWYPDPQTPGQVRWWDGTNWTEHVSVPAQPAQEPALHAVPPLTDEVATSVVVESVDAGESAAEPGAEPAAAAEPAGYGRHAAGTQPAPRRAASVPQIRPRARVEVPVESLSYA